MATARIRSLAKGAALEKAKRPIIITKIFIVRKNGERDGKRSTVLKESSSERVGVPVMAQWSANPTENHGVAGSIPGLAQWVKDPGLP